MAMLGDIAIDPFPVATLMYDEIKWQNPTRVQCMVLERVLLSDENPARKARVILKWMKYAPWHLCRARMKVQSIIDNRYRAACRRAAEKAAKAAVKAAAKAVAQAKAKAKAAAAKPKAKAKAPPAKAKARPKPQPVNR